MTRSRFLMLCAAPVLALRSVCQTLQSPPKDEAAELYESAARLLRAGQDYPKAIRRLEQAVPLKPDDPRYQSALGCAYGARFASVSVAALIAERYEGEQRFYESNRKQWEADQQDPAGRLHGFPAPTEPRPPVTLDDDRRFSLNPHDTRLEQIRLGRRALAAFDRARELAENKPAADRKEAAFARGWGLFLLRRFGAEWVLDARPPGAKNAPGQDGGPLVIPPEEIAACFRECLKEESDDRLAAQYRYSLGLALAPKLLSPEAARAGDEETRVFRPDEVRDASAELLAVLDKQPAHRGALLAMGPLTLDAREEPAVRYFETAAEADRGNAVAWYQASEAAFRRSEQQKGDEAKRTTKTALGFAEKGNAAARYRAVFLPTAAPEMLRKAWEYAEAYAIPDGYLAVNLGGRLMHAARDAEKAGDLEAAVAGYRLQFEFGWKVLSAMLGEDVDTRLPNASHLPRLRRMFGALHCCAGYKSLAEIQKKQPDDRLAVYLDVHRGQYEEALALDRIPY